MFKLPCKYYMDVWGLKNKIFLRLGIHHLFMALVHRTKSITMSDISLLHNLYVILFTTEHFIPHGVIIFQHRYMPFMERFRLMKLAFRCCVIREQTLFFW